MQNKPPPIEVGQEAGHGTVGSYILGFLLSLVLTFTAYFVVARDIFIGWAATSVIIVLGLIQTWVQLFFFLHLGEESKPRWNLLVFLFMALVLVIIVGGSLWIMNNLTYQVMPQMDLGTYLHHQE